MFKKRDMRHFEYLDKGFLFLFKVYNPSKPNAGTPSTSPPIGPGRGYVPPESSSQSYYGGGGSTPSSGTVYIYKGREYSSEADVKNAIASETLGSPKVQEILKKQGGSSETVYIYGGSTYTSPSEVQSQIQKETVSSPSVQNIMAV